MLVWLVAVGALAPLSGRLTGVEQNSQSSFVPAGAAATEVASYEAHFPHMNSLPALVVLYRPAGMTASDGAAAAADQRRISSLDIRGVTAVGPSTVAPSGTGLIFPVTLAPGTGAVTVAADVTKITAALGPAPDGLQEGVGGSAAALADTASAFSGINGTLLLATVAIVTVLLLLTYRSVLMWIFPLVGVGLATVLGQAGVYLLARSGFVVNGMTVGILTVLMFGAGTDYSLLLVARYREELRRTESVTEAMRTALRRVTPTLLTSAGTVILGLLMLLLSQENDIRALGPVGAIGIAAVLLATLTVVPAVLVIVGRRAFWPLVPRLDSSARSARISWGGDRGKSWSPSRAHLAGGGGSAGRHDLRTVRISGQPARLRRFQRTRRFGVCPEPDRQVLPARDQRSSRHRGSRCGPGRAGRRRRPISARSALRGPDRDPRWDRDRGRHSGVLPDREAG